MPSLQWTYATLAAALQDWPTNDNEEYVANLPIMIGLAELRLIKDLDLEIFDKEDTSVTFTIGSRLVLRPADCIALRAIGYIDPTLGYTPLKLRSLDYCKRFSPLIATQATPQFYVEYSTTQIYVVDTPSAALALHMHYVARPADLLAALTPNATSFLSVRVPDALFSACLMECEHYLQADDRYNDYKSKYYDELLPTARFELRNLRKRGDYSPFEPSARSK